MQRPVADFRWLLKTGLAPENGEGKRHLRSRSSRRRLRDRRKAGCRQVSGIDRRRERRQRPPAFADERPVRLRSSPSCYALRSWSLLPRQGCEAALISPAFRTVKGETRLSKFCPTLLRPGHISRLLAATIFCGTRPVQRRRHPCVHRRHRRLPAARSASLP
jgi:hypothetical protein